MKMEEKKLTDDTEIDVGMIVKALECCKQKGGKDTCKYCYTCPASVWDFEDGITECNVDLFQKALNLIHRLQSENERLTEERDEYLTKAFYYYGMCRRYGIESIYDEDLEIKPADGGGTITFPKFKNIDKGVEVE